MGEVIHLATRTAADFLQADRSAAALPDFEYMFLSNLILRLGDRGFASLARAITDAAENTNVTTRGRAELDGLVDLGISFLAPAAGSAR